MFLDYPRLTKSKRSQHVRHTHDREQATGIKNESKEASNRQEVEILAVNTTS